MFSRLDSDQLAANLGDALTTLADVSLKAAVILLSALALCFLLRNKAARARHLLWSAALLGILVLPALSFVMPAWRWRALPALPAPAMVLPLPGEPGAPARPGAASETLPMDLVNRRGSTPVATDAGPISSTRPPVAGPTLVGPNPQPERASANWQAWAFGVWLAGVLVVLGWFRLGLARADRFARNATPLDERLWRDLIEQSKRSMNLTGKIRLLKSDEIDTPVTWGYSRPLILLPAAAEKWPDQRRAIVLMHELLHVKRRDWLMQIVARLASAMYWFNPLAWLAARRLAVERELACDADVIALGARPSEYATHLLDIAKALSRRTAVPVSALTMATSKLEGRLTAILSRSRRERTALVLAPAIIALAGIVLSLAAIRPWRELPAMSGRSALRTNARESSLMIATARDLLRQENWSQAARILEQVTRADPTAGSAWFDLGYARHAAGEWDRAVAAHLKATEYPQLRGGAWYNIACAYALTGRVDRAFDALEASRAAGFYTQPQAILNDADLINLHSDSRFQRLLDNFVPLKYRLELLDKAGNLDGMAELLRNRRASAANMVRSFLDDSLVLHEVYGDAEREAITELNQRALRMARAADQAFAATVFTTYAQRRIGWDDEQRQLFRDAEEIDAALHPTAVRRTNFAPAIRSAKAVETLTRALGDTIGLTRALVSRGNLHFSVVSFATPRRGVSATGELEAALAAYSEARSLARRLGLSYYEVLASHGMAGALIQLDRPFRALTVVAEGIDLLAGIPDSHFCTEFNPHFNKLRIAAEKMLAGGAG